MKTLMFAAAAGALLAVPSVRIEPAVITSCQNGSGQAAIFWNGDGAAPVTLYAGNSPMTGQEETTGSTRTGIWVTDGMTFSLRNSAGQTIASAQAVLKCDAGGWWPLDVGNEWHFRVNDRVVTGAHTVWKIARKEQIDGVFWAVLDPGPFGVTKLRAEADGRIFRLADDGRELLLIDPNGLESGVWKVGGRTPAAITLAGTFSDELSWQGPIAGLGQENGRLARGVGPTYYQTNVIAGSSGGFGSGFTLLEAIVGGARFLPNYPKVELLLESQRVNLSAKSARNCAIPCYFTACFGADLAPVYKPCMEASVRGGSGKLTLTDASGAVVFESLTNGWVRIPLYREPATALPAGKYSVTANVAGTTVTLPLEIQ
ncbi:MAG: hypothetical protein HYX27_17970 [Acidobacteria bacterium]|nr:hypothetical protein [Acidobacteriota bacterium]